MRRRFSAILIAAVLLTVATTLSGCSFGAPSISMTFSPSTVTLKAGQPVNVSVTLTLNGFGSFEIKRLSLSYITANGDEIENAEMYGLPTGGDLDNAITLFGTLGLASKTLSLAELNNGEEIIPAAGWWLIHPHPVGIVLTFFDGSGKLVGRGELGLVWSSLVG